MLYLRVPRLIEELRIAHGDGSYIRLLKTVAKGSLIERRPDFAIHPAFNSGTLHFTNDKSRN